MAMNVYFGGLKRNVVRIPIKDCIALLALTIVKSNGGITIHSSTKKKLSNEQLVPEWNSLMPVISTIPNL